MCGIAAFVAKPHTDERVTEADTAAVGRMVDTLRFRGPDEQGVADVGGAVFGHSRLSIIDLCGGSQPVYNEDGSVAVIFNGEIYNYRELRRSLEAAGHRFRTNSDTEVIVHLYEDEGVELFTKLNGMFAIALWDRVKQRLVAGRDRTGEKPFLYHESARGLVLASELKALLQFPGIPKEVDRHALGLYFTAMYVPGPLSIFASVRKLLPGHVLVYDATGLSVRPYWQLQPRPDPSASVESLIDEFRWLFADAVKMRMVADVPLGVFLSGGIDSSAVGAQMALAGDDAVRTFTVGFGSDIDERPFARMVAERYGTQHQELLIEADLLDAFQRIYGYMDEPFGDSSIVPTYLISRAAREHVKVILTGEGGDELFAGYPMYVDQKYRSENRVIGKVTRLLNAAAIQWLDLDFVARHDARSRRAFASWHDTRSVFRPSELASLLDFPVAPSIDFFRERVGGLNGAGSLTTAFLYDLSFYLPDDLLKKVDMASMRASLECRAPFLDHRLVEWALRVPPGLKLQGDRAKALLRRAVEDILPPPILRRPKQGFGAPIGAWLRNQLKSLALDVTAPGCRAEQFLRRDAIQSARCAITADVRSNDYRVDSRLWLIVVFENWLRKYA